MKHNGPTLRRLHPTLSPEEGKACRTALPGQLRKEKAVSKATYPLKLPASVKATAARLAKEDGVSLNQ